MYWVNWDSRQFLADRITSIKWFLCQSTLIWNWIQIWARGVLWSSKMEGGKGGSEGGKKERSFQCLKYKFLFLITQREFESFPLLFCPFKMINNYTYFDNSEKTFTQYGISFELKKSFFHKDIRWYLKL